MGVRDEELVLEGWQAIGSRLGIAGSPNSLRKRLLGWEQHEGLPVFRRRGRIFAQADQLDAWHRASLRGAPKSIK
jgi:hypothetical protein